ncbi:hypothetical protein L910_1390 [Vibrio fluvialis PG41]|uniref:ParB/Spo0J HTH domain-containing protein n=1 Tax=Vibrio fluvialis PG41 TaxID=1336752 RepID=S7I017_VIBFL|nr:hypothetical protein [Vibrio fluvialis]EPP21399.1 hypothetical protein L910_1390 [Vibrio fluvialis PG41]
MTSEIAISSNKSLRGLSGDKEVAVKRVNAYNADPKLLWIEQGFNVRDICDEHVENFVASYSNGKYVPAIEVVPVTVNDELRLKIIEGHHRTLAVFRAIERGIDIKNVSVIEVQGNEVDHIARMIKSAEGRKLTALELAAAYKRMMGLGLTQTQVAEELMTTSAQVSNYLLLLKAPEELKEMIKSGTIAASNAVGLIRDFGADMALEAAKEEHRAKEVQKEAKANGVEISKSDATPKTKKLKLKAKKVSSMSDIVYSLAGQIQIDELEKNEEVTIKLNSETAKVLLSLSSEISELNEHNAKVDELLKNLAIESKKNKSSDAEGE